MTVVLSFIRNRYPDVKLIANSKNVGFGKANNKAMQIASGDYFILINPDTFVKNDTLEKLLSFFESNKNVDIATCKVLNPDGSLQLACRRSFPSPWISFTKIIGLNKLFPKTKLFAKYNLTYLDENKTYEVDAISGSFMMFKREVYDKIGGFDTDFFMYGEDLDFCYRAKKNGFKIYYYHETEIIHYKGESTKRSSIDEHKHFHEAMSLFVKKNISSSKFLTLILEFGILLKKMASFISRIKFIIFPFDY